MMEDLKPCPFCRGNGKLSYRQMRFIGQNYRGDKKIKIGAQVICNRCKARGALYSGVVLDPYVRAEKEKDAAFIWITKEAIEAWNRRAKEE